ncbi:MAG: energy-coupling factor ABC transporter ATP-binding protein [Thermoplasmata archaeon]|nr:energy-coupling factor ABC transporter ATP-binding protein [Thermoplasmata archaeon]
MGDNRIIEAEGITYTYPDGTLAVENAHFYLERGERVAIVGPNGSGKSTLLKILSALMEPQEGSIRFYGKENVKEKELRKKFGIILQNPDDMLFNATVMEDLEFGPAQIGMKRNEFEKILEELDEIFSLSPLLKKPPFKLSEGEKQRVAMACALATKPEVLFLDEPFSALDVGMKRKVVEYLNKLNAEGMAMVTVSHELDIIPRVADRVYLLNRRVVAEGKVEEILSNDKILTENGMEPLPVAKIAAALGMKDIPLTIEEFINALKSK